VEDDIDLVAAWMDGGTFQGLPDDLARCREGKVKAAKMQGWLRVIIAILITLGVLSVASVPVMLRLDLGILKGAPGLADALLTQIGILVLSLALISIFTRGKISPMALFDRRGLTSDARWLMGPLPLCWFRVRLPSSADWPPGR
jgi:hypothetical protein